MAIEPRRAVVVGAGITGLTVAHRLSALASAADLPLTVTLLDETSRTGGVIGTHRAGGVTAELGPDCFISEKPQAIQLTRELGFEGELQGTNTAHRRSFILKDRRLIPIPDGLYLLAPSAFWPFALSPLVSLPGKLRMALDLVIPRRTGDGDESLADFVRRRLGHEALARIAQPMVGGIFTADPETLSVQATFPQFLEMERAHGSVIRGLLAGKRARSAAQAEAGKAAGARYGLFLSYREGLATLPERLTAALPPGTFQGGAKVESIGFHPAGGFTVRLEDRRELPADLVCLAVPAHRAAALLPESEAELGRRLREIHYSSSVTVNLLFRRDRIRHDLDGMGFVVPAIEEAPFMACTFSSMKFPGRAPEGHVLLRAYVGGELHEESTTLPDEELSTSVIRGLTGLLGISGAPELTLISRHPRVMPQYHVGHLDRVGAIERRIGEIRGLALAGNAYRGVGIPDCIRSAETAARKLWDDLTGSGSPAV